MVKPVGLVLVVSCPLVLSVVIPGLIGPSGPLVLRSEACMHKPDVAPLGGVASWPA